MSEYLASGRTIQLHPRPAQSLPSSEWKIRRKPRVNQGPYSQKDQRASRQVGAPGRAQGDGNIDFRGLGCRGAKGDRKFFLHTKWISSQAWQLEA